MKEKTFLVACMDFFGKKEGQSNMDFAKEVRGFTEDDRKEIAPMLEKDLDCKITNVVTA